MGFKITTPPANEPVSVQEAKDHLRVDVPEEDALISELIIAAREYVELVTRRPLITQSQTLYIDSFDTIIELKPNLQSITTIKYLDPDGVQQTLADTEYTLSTSDVVGTVFEDYNKTWPSIRNESNAVEIEFICGYGLAADVPAAIKQAMLLIIGHWYMNRESVTVGVSVSETPQAVGMLLSSHRVVSF